MAELASVFSGRFLNQEVWFFSYNNNETIITIIIIACTCIEENIFINPVRKGASRTGKSCTVPLDASWKNIKRKM